MHYTAHQEQTRAVDLLRLALEVHGEAGPVPTGDLLLQAGTVPQAAQVPGAGQVPMADMVPAVDLPGEAAPVPAGDLVRATRGNRPTSMDTGRLRVMARFNNISSCM